MGAAFARGVVAAGALARMAERVEAAMDGCGVWRWLENAAPHAEAGAEDGLQALSAL
jgi:hypothetical protein